MSNQSDSFAAGLSRALQIQQDTANESLNSVYKPREPGNAFGSATGQDKSGAYRSVVVDGKSTVHYEGKLSSSHAQAVAAAEVDAGVPYTRARDTLGNPVMPHQLTEDTIVTIRGQELTVAQARSIGWLP